LKVVIQSVNGCKTPEEYRKKMSDLIDSSIQMLHDSLLQIHSTLRPLHIEYIRNNLEDLRLLVADEQSVIHDETGNFSRLYTFKTFTNCRLVSLKDGNCQMFGQYIRFKASKFAEVWLEVLNGAINRLNLIHNLLIQLPPDNPTSHLQLITPPDKFKLKFDLTVAQIGALGKLFSKVGLIKIPTGQAGKIINWIIDNIQSIDRDFIKFLSMRKNYFTFDPDALDFWEEVFTKLLAIIRKEKEKLSK